MTTETVQLKTGEQLVIKTLHPPLYDYVSKVGCWGDVRDDLLNGKLTEWLFTPYFVGEIDGEVVGSMSYYTPTDTRDVGVVEFVRTEEEHRSKGIASALMDCLIRRFRVDDGIALYLCTTNPIAGSLYEKHGFWYHLGDGMRYLAPMPGTSIKPTWRTAARRTSEMQRGRICRVLPPSTITVSRAGSSRTISRRPSAKPVLRAIL